MRPSAIKKNHKESLGARLLDEHRAKKFNDSKDPKNPVIPKFSKGRGVRVRQTEFVCYKCDLIFSNGWKYNTSNLGAITLCEQCKTKVIPLKTADLMMNALQGGGADGGK